MLHATKWMNLSVLRAISRCKYCVIPPYAGPGGVRFIETGAGGEGRLESNGDRV